MATYQCGHRHCRQRYKFKKPLEQMHRRPRVLRERSGVWVCGVCRIGMLNPTEKFLRSWNRPRTCYCDGYCFPHMKAQGECRHSPDGQRCPPSFMR
jgi:hypothetical protein